MAYYFNNRFSVTAGSVTGTVQAFVFTVPTSNTPVAANVLRYPSFLISVAATGATGTNTAALTLADGTSLPLVGASDMTALVVSKIIAGTVIQVAPKVVNGVLSGVAVNL